MDIFDLTRSAWRTTRDRKPLWLFALFTGGVNASLSISGAAEQLPIAWIVGCAALAMLIAFTVRVLGETALIRGVHRGELGWLFRESKRLFPAVALIHLTGGVAILLTSLAMLSPLLLVPLAHAPIGLAIALTVPLALVGMPIVLTIAFVYEYALRFAVLEDASAREAWAEARRHLQGRIVESMYVAILAYVGRSILQTVFVIFVIPALLLGALTYAAAGVIPGVVVFAMLALPVALVAQAVAQTFASSVWTHAFLRGRG